MTLSCSKKAISIIKRKHHGDFYCLNCLHSFATEKILKFKKNDFCNVIMSFKDTKVIEFNQYQKYDKVPFIICPNFQCVIERIDGCKNNPENSSTTKVGEHSPSGFPMSTISSFRIMENKHDVYRGKNCMKKFCESLREHALKIINFKKKKRSY